MWGRTRGRDRRRERQNRKETKTERKRRNERILIRNLKNKIIRLPDSKCQLWEGSRWREEERARQRHTKTYRKKGRGRRENGEKETFRRRQVGLE